MLTFEAIREFERNEKNTKKLQKLPENITEEVRDYIKRKESIKDKSSSDIFELENMKNTVKRFFELRENKIMLMALSTARTGLPPENLTKYEEMMFYNLVEEIKRNREFFFAEIEKNTVEMKEELIQEEAQKRIIYRVKKEMKEFIGPDMKTYRLVRGEIVNLPKPLNDLLLKEGVIEEIREKF